MAAGDAGCPIETNLAEAAKRNSNFTKTFTSSSFNTIEENKKEKYETDELNTKKKKKKKKKNRMLFFACFCL